MSNSPLRVLLIGDQPECLRLLRQEQFEAVGAGRLADGLAQLKTTPVTLVLLALSLPDARGLETFAKLHEAAPLLPIIVLATPAEEKLAASLMPLGAQDYLLVPELTGSMLARAIRNARERHLIREEHSRAGHLLELLMDNIPDSIYFKDKASQFVMINRAHARRFGLADPHLAVGKSDADFFSAEHAKQALADEQHVIETGQPLVGIEEKETWPDGRVTWVSTTKMPLRDRAGRIFGTFGISRDITEHRRIEQALAERSAELLKERLLLRTLIDNLPDAIYAKDSSGRKTMANPADLRNMHCKTEAEALGKTDFDFFPPDQARKFHDDDQKVLQGQPVINREEFFLDDRGRKHWLLTSKLPLRDKEEKITGLVGIGRDITKRKEAEDKLAHEEELFRILLDNLPDAIYFKDRESRFLRVSRSKVERSLTAVRSRYAATHPEAGPEQLPEYLRSLEQFAEHMPGKTDFDFYTDDRAQPAYEDEQQIIRTGQPSIGRLERAVRPDGEVNWIITTKMPWRDKDGNIIGTFGVSRDVTALKDAEEKLAGYTRQLEQKNKQAEEELKMARELQLAMLPHEFPCVPRQRARGDSDLEFFSYFFPAGAVSGDFFDVLPLSDTMVGLFICDVMGHDVRAALVTAMMRALVVDLSTPTTEPGDLLAQINREVAGVFQQTDSTMYATAFYLIADVARGELRYASAAHPEPLLLHRQQGTVEWLGRSPGQKKGPALGLFAEGQFFTHRCPMKVGDLIALFTDGLIDVAGANNETFSTERLLAAVRARAKLPANELFTSLLDEIKKFSARSEFEDDVCIVGMEVKRLESETASRPA
jgi:phosphoserine phosphatase RsbU/P